MARLDDASRGHAMKELYILRHGIAVPYGTPGMADDDRPLTPEGEQRMKQIGSALATIELQVDRIITSPLPRALRTAQIVADKLDITDRLECADILRAGNDATTIRDWLLERDDNRLMIVGHDPAFSELVGLLLLGEIGKLPLELKKGGMAALSSSADSGPPFQLDWIAPPRLLRRLGDQK
jgi:phosphohistidine phosphatase